jgi:hypothetical protein
VVSSLFGSGRDYQKLGPTRLTWLGTVELWEGSDHLAQIELIGVHEYCKRFYYKDIKGLTMSRNRAGFRLHLAHGTLALIAVGLALYSAAGKVSLGALDWALIVCATITVGAWLIHFLRGPTCVCSIVTPVQKAQLRSLTRVRPARQTLARLASRIRAEQGALAADSALAAEAVPGAAPLELDASPSFDTSLRQATGSAQPSKGRSLVLFGLSLVAAGALFGMLLWKSLVLGVASLIGMLVVEAFVISCLATRKVKGGAAMASWVLLICGAALLACWYGYTFYAIFTESLGGPASAVGLDELAVLQGISKQDNDFLRWSTLIAASITMLCGVAGLALTWSGDETSQPPVADTTGPEGT